MRPFRGGTIGVIATEFASLVVLAAFPSWAAVPPTELPEGAVITPFHDRLVVDVVGLDAGAAVAFVER